MNKTVNSLIALCIALAVVVAALGIFAIVTIATRDDGSPATSSAAPAKAPTAMPTKAPPPAGKTEWDEAYGIVESYGYVYNSSFGCDQWDYCAGFLDAEGSTAIGLFSETKGKVDSVVVIVLASATDDGYKRSGYAVADVLITALDLPDKTMDCITSDTEGKPYTCDNVSVVPDIDSDGFTVAYIIF